LDAWIELGLSSSVGFIALFGAWCPMVCRDEVQSLSMLFEQAAGGLRRNSTRGAADQFAPVLIPPLPWLASGFIPYGGFDYPWSRILATPLWRRW